MPYIKLDKRIDLDALVSLIMTFCDNNPFNGDINYILTKLSKEYIKINGESYNNYKQIIGEIECFQLELYRRLIAKYEDKKIIENGDV